MRQLTLDGLLSSGAERNLRDANPWWRGDRQYDIATIKRWAYAPVLKGLLRGLAPVTVLRGPRQVGKTTLLNQIIDELLTQGVNPTRIFRVQFDDIPDLRRLETPILDLAAWYADNVIGQSFQAFAREQKGPVYLLLDEVQNLPDWATQLKHLVDLQPVRAIVTGSSALRIEAGRDSLAGRVSTIEIGPLLLREISEMHGASPIAPFLPYNGLGVLKDKTFWENLRSFGEAHRALRDQAFAWFSDLGGYPLAHKREDATWECRANLSRQSSSARFKTIFGSVSAGEGATRRCWKRSFDSPAAMPANRPGSRSISTKCVAGCMQTSVGNAS